MVSRDKPIEHIVAVMESQSLVEGCHGGFISIGNVDITVGSLAVIKPLHKLMGQFSAHALAVELGGDIQVVKHPNSGG